MDHGGKRAGAGRPLGAKNKASNTEYSGITEMLLIHSKLHFNPFFKHLNSF